MNENYLTSLSNDDFKKNINTIFDVVNSINFPDTTILSQVAIQQLIPKIYTAAKVMKPFTEVNSTLQSLINSSPKSFTHIGVLAKSMEDLPIYNNLAEVSKVMNSISRLNLTTSTFLGLNNSIPNSYINMVKNITKIQNDQFKTAASSLEEIFNPVNITNLTLNVGNDPKNLSHPVLKNFLSNPTEKTLPINDDNFVTESINNSHNKNIEEMQGASSQSISNQDIYEFFDYIKQDVEEIKADIKHSNSSPSEKYKLRHEAKSFIISTVATLIINMFWDVAPLLTFYLLTMAFEMVNTYLKD